jgi:hypothetical protein
VPSVAGVSCLKIAPYTQSVPFEISSVLHALVRGICGMRQYLCSWKHSEPFPKIDCVFSPDIGEARIWKIKSLAVDAGEDFVGHEFLVPMADGSLFYCRRLEMLEARPGEFVFYCDVPEAKVRGSSANPEPAPHDPAETNEEVEQEEHPKKRGGKNPHSQST